MLLVNSDLDNGVALVQRQANTVNMNSAINMNTFIVVLVKRNQITYIFYFDVTTWTNLYPEPRHHMASLGLNPLNPLNVGLKAISVILFYLICIYTKSQIGLLTGNNIISVYLRKD